MSRLSKLDTILVFILTPLWIGLFGLAVGFQFEGPGTALLGLTVEDSDSYPVLTGKASVQYSSDPLERAGLQAGDRLVDVGNSDLRGVGTYGLFVRVAQVSGNDLTVPLSFERDGVRRTTSLELIPASTVRPMLVTSIALALSALFLLLRARPTPCVRAFYYMGMCMALANATQSPSAGFYLPYWLGFLGSVGVGVACFVVFQPLLIRFLFLFPDDVAPEGRWHQIWPWFLSVPSGLFLAVSYTRWIEVGDLGGLITGITNITATLCVATYKFRRAEPLARRQMKWAVLGTYCVLLPIGAAEVIAVLAPELAWLTYLSFGALAFFPLSILVSISRFNLFDIDRILSVTASFNTVGVGLGAGAFLLVPSFAQAMSAASGVTEGTGQALLSLGFAAAVIPAHRVLSPQIDRMLFRERYSLEHGIADALPTFAACHDSRALTARVGDALNTLMLPVECVIYARVGQAYTPVFVAGQVMPPAIDADSPLVETLTHRSKPLHLADVGRRPDEVSLGPLDRKALATFQAEVVVPVRRDVSLSSFICLGPKRSGDVYSDTDISHFATVADAIARELRRFNQDDLAVEAREMHASLLH